MARRAAAAAARPAPARRAPVRRPPRRLSGPSAGGAVALPGRVMRAPFTRAARARAGGVLDALLQGRAWIALVAVLLVGIVFFNVDLLELNRDIAHTADKAARMKRENAALRLKLAQLASSERIQRVAAPRGLELPAPGEVRYLRLHPGADPRRAAARITEPGTGTATPVSSGTPAPAPAPTAQSAPPAQAAPAAPAAGTQTAPQTTTTTPTPPPTTTTPAAPAAGSPTGGAAPATPAPAPGTGG
jgi:cell division protein FtsL